MRDDKFRAGLPKLVFLLLVLAIAGVGYYIFQQQARHLKESAQRELATIADLKAEQLVRWRSERQGDAQAVSQDYFLASAVAQWFQAGSPPDERQQRLLDRLTTLQKAYDYQAVELLDDQGTVHLSTAAAHRQVSGTTRDLAIEAMRTGTLLFSDLHRAEEEPGQPIRIDLLAPLLDENRQAIGVLLFRIDPDRFLFPLIQSWPNPSACAETLLVERSGNDVLFLNELRHQKQTALTLRLPINAEHLPAALAARGQEGVFEGIDYRSIPVLAATRKIPDSPWAIVAKVDQQEVYAPIHERTLLIAELTVVLVALASVLTALWWRQKSARMAARDYQSRLERQALIQHFDYLAKYANDIIFLYDRDFRIVEMNDRALMAYGYTREELLGLHINKLHTSEAAEFDRHRQQLAERKALMYETQALRKDKTVFPVEVSERMIVTEGRTFYQSIIRDITERKQAEEALRASQIDLNRAQAVAHIGSWRMDIRTNSVAWSDENYRIFGVPQGTPLTYQSFLDAVHPADRALVDQAWKDALAGKHYDLEHRVIATQKIKWVRELAELEFDEHGSLLGAFGTTEDITDIKSVQEALQHERAFLRQVIDAVPSMIFVKDEKRRFLLGNKAMAQFYNTSPESLTELTDEDFKPHADEVARVHQDDHEVISSRKIKFIPEEKVTHADGSVHWYSTVKLPLFDEDNSCDKLLGVATDITKRKRAEEALRLADRRKDEFLAMLAHELRNPLAPIRNAVQLLKMQEAADPKLAWSRNVIDRQVTHMARLLDDLLDVARIMRGKIRLSKERVELTEIVNNAIETSRPLIEARHQELIVSQTTTPQWIEGDRIRLAQVLSNLLNNAAKYTDEGGKITLSVMRENADAVIEVRDNGIGIAPDILPQIFDLFTQADHSLAHSQGGLGLGLTLVRQLVEIHGGTVTAASAGIGQGSTFTVRLPTLSMATSPTESALAPSTLPISKKFRVLVVDDYVDAAESLAMLLQAEGHEVEIADCGLQAIEQAQAFRPQVVLLDIGLPDLDGYEVAQRLRTLPETHDAILIALTGYGQAEDRERAQNAGFDHHLLKPVNFEQLSALLAAH
jgi:PAS domain S-box-containing protein